MTALIIIGLIFLYFAIGLTTSAILEGKGVYKSLPEEGWSVLVTLAWPFCAIGLVLTIMFFKPIGKGYSAVRELAEGRKYS